MKRFFALLLALTICLGMGVTAFAEAPADPASEAAESSEIQPRVEETEWVYYIFGDSLYKREWSNTYGYWKTDWIYVGPAPTT